MKYEYAVMEQVGDAEPTIVSDGFKDYQSAYRELGDCWQQLDDLRRGVTIYTPEDALRAAESFRAAKVTRYYVTRREVGEWQGEVYE